MNHPAFVAAPGWVLPFAVLLLCIAVLSLAGCATVTPAPGPAVVDWEARRAELRALEAWRTVVDAGLDPAFLADEADRARRGTATPDCRDGSCAVCGVCGDGVEMDVLA